MDYIFTISIWIIFLSNAVKSRAFNTIFSLGWLIIAVFYQVSERTTFDFTDNYNYPNIKDSNGNTPLNDKKESLNPLCDPISGDPTCGTIEFLGCAGNKQFYHESTVKLNWHEAWEFCRTYGMHLASIESRFEQLFLETFLNKPDVLVETYWTSGTMFSGRFTWMATGKPFTYFYWRAGEPNNRNRIELCVELVTMSYSDNFPWNDRSCNSPAYALCQKNMDMKSES